MEKQCPKCGGELDSQWTYCPRCGGLIAVHPLHAEPPEKSPAPGAFGGLVFGVLAVPILVIVGGMLCLTGLGAFLGIPMIIAAVLAPLLGPLAGMRAHSGKCPHCGAAVGDIGEATESRECPVCNKSFSIRPPQVTKAA